MSAEQRAMTWEQWRQWQAEVNGFGSYDDMLAAALETGRAKVEREQRFAALFRPPATRQG